jgi:hypothetical protein
MRSRIRAGLAAALLLAPLLALAVPSAASAAVNCSGSLIDTATLKVGGNVKGTLYVYYNSSTRKNCAKATNTSGATREMSLWLARCRPGTGDSTVCDPIDQSSDYGNYHSYAGPIDTKGPSAGLCIEAGVWMRVGSDYPHAYVTGHCG